jgi:hypothetical protein
MIAPPIEPLHPEMWFEQIGTLATRISRPEGAAPDAVIRKAFYLVQLAPAPLRDVISCRTEEADFERLLARGDYDAAVAALIAPPVAFEISTDPEQGCVNATVRLPDDAGVGSASDGSMALALLAAWSRCLGSLRAGAALDLTPDRGPRRARSGPPPRSSRH